MVDWRGGFEERSVKRGSGGDSKMEMTICPSKRCTRHVAVEPLGCQLGAEARSHDSKVLVFLPFCGADECRRQLTPVKMDW